MGCTHSSADLGPRPPLRRSSSGNAALERAVAGLRASSGGGGGGDEAASNWQTRVSSNDLLGLKRERSASSERPPAPVEDVSGHRSAFSIFNLDAAGGAAAETLPPAPPRAPQPLLLGLQAPESQTHPTLGIRYGRTEEQGKRESMEDDSAALLALDGIPDTCFFGVFDGHGGSRCSRFVANALPGHIRRAVVDEGLSWESAVGRACASADEEWLDGGGGDDSGSTGIFALLSPERMVVGCVGDSQAVLSRAGLALDLCVHHKPDNPDEQARIEAANGRVVNGRIFGVLGVSRAFGDCDLKTSRGQFKANFNGDLVSSVPDVAARDVEKDDEFLLLACDGLFDVLTPQSAVNFIRRQLDEHKDVQRCCDELVQHAVRKLKSTDNVSAIVVVFPPPSTERATL